MVISSHQVVRPRWRRGSIQAASVNDLIAFLALSLGSSVKIRDLLRISFFFGSCSNLCLGAYLMSGPCERHIRALISAAADTRALHRRPPARRTGRQDLGVRGRRPPGLPTEETLMSSSFLVCSSSGNDRHKALFIASERCSTTTPCKSIIEKPFSFSK
jgi:hypothetical protein